MVAWQPEGVLRNSLTSYIEMNKDYIIGERKSENRKKINEH